MGKKNESGKKFKERRSKQQVHFKVLCRKKFANKQTQCDLSTDLEVYDNYEDIFSKITFPNVYIVNDQLKFKEKNIEALENKENISKAESQDMVEKKQTTAPSKKNKFNVVCAKNKKESEDLKVVIPKCFPVMTWLVDSGASEHMINCQDYFDEYTDLIEPVTVIVAKSGVNLYATKIGVVRGFAIVNNEKVEYRFKEVLYVPDLEANLFSVPKSTTMKLKIIFEGSVCEIMKRDKVIAVALKEDKLYEFKIFFYYTNKVGSLCRKQNHEISEKQTLNNLDIAKKSLYSRKSILQLDVKPKREPSLQMF